MHNRERRQTCRDRWVDRCAGGLGGSVSSICCYLSVILEIRGLLQCCYYTAQSLTIIPISLFFYFYNCKVNNWFSFSKPTQIWDSKWSSINKYDFLMRVWHLSTCDSLNNSYGSRFNIALHGWTFQCWNHGSVHPEMILLSW